MCSRYSCNKDEAKLRLRDKIPVYGAVPRASLARGQCTSRKNCAVPLLVTITLSSQAVTGCHAEDDRFVADWSTHVGNLSGHVTDTPPSERVMNICGVARLVE